MCRCCVITFLIEGPHLTGAAKLHWTDMFLKPGHSIAQWHHLENVEMTEALQREEMERRMEEVSVLEMTHYQFN